MTETCDLFVSFAFILIVIYFCIYPTHHIKKGTFFTFILIVIVTSTTNTHTLDKNLLNYFDKISVMCCPTDHTRTYFTLGMMSEKPNEKLTRGDHPAASGLQVW